MSRPFRGGFSSRGGFTEHGGGSNYRGGQRGRGTQRDGRPPLNNNRGGPSGGPAFRGPHQGPRRVPIIGYKRLKELQSKSSSEIISALAGNLEGLKQLLDSPNIKPDWMFLLIEILGKASDTHMSQNLISVFSNIRDTAFLTRHLPVFIMTDLTDDNSSNGGLPKILRSLIRFYDEWLNRFPASYSLLPLESLQRRLTFIDTSDAEMEQVNIDLERTMKERDEIIQKEKARRTASARGAQAEATPPNDFREISVFPQPEDLISNIKPFLRKNIIKGKYKSVQDYLDVQFRLLREDFISPLRDGIAEIAHGATQQKRLNTDIRVYHDVRILYPVCTKSGITHKICFDVSSMGRVQWKYSKRLIYGSLVCLSKDNFKTFLLATVANRDVADLSKGQIEVFFHGGLRAVSEIQDTDSFVMGESSGAYFESYRHVLEGLKEFPQDKFPFKKYLVECNSNVEAPVYLRHDERLLRYDLRTALDCKSPRSENVPVLSPVQWPDESETSLNASQMEAMKASLTKEFVVVQGPPGTGKTYVGLKIVQALLNNRSTWDRTKSSPLLLVCYTNHALDQFLEGILEFTSEGIVRVGSRSSSDKLKPFNLQEYTKNKPGHDRSRDSMRAKAEAWNGMERARDKVDSMVRNLETTEKNVLSMVYLSQFMIPNHRSQIFEYGLPYRRISQLESWLGILPTTRDAQMVPNPYQEFLDDIEQQEEAENIDVIGDAEALEEQRLLFGENDFARMSDAVVHDDEVEDVDDMMEEVALDDGGGWQVVEMTKAAKKQHLRRGLTLARQPMTKLEADAVNNVWALTQQERWRLYGFWLHEYRETLNESLAEHGQTFEDYSERLKEIRSQEEEAILRDAIVIGMTTTGAAKYRGVLQQIQPKIVVVEEAAEVLEAHIVTSISPGTQHLILIGDHKQLRPNPTVFELARKYNLEISLFERMVHNNMQCIQLNTQHRMRPEIAHLMSHIYKGLKNHETVLNVPDVLGVTKNVFFIDHEEPETLNQELRSPSNMHEALYIKSLCRYLLLQGYLPSQITVLTMYTGQLLALKKVMDKVTFEGVRVTAVDDFQGEENDIILLSLVRSNKEGKIGFLKTNNRICVALSRAKIGLFCIGNMSVLTEQSDLWKRIVCDMQRKDSIGDALQLSCRNHPEKAISARCMEDFNKAPEGGCDKPCEFRLTCGHVCDRACHPIDQLHEETKCRKLCLKSTCPLHQCQKRCHFLSGCGSCIVPIMKALPNCRHQQMVPCSKDVLLVDCKTKCQKQLKCGHQCSKMCSEPCNEERCQEKVQRDLSCGHKAPMQCMQDPSEVSCPIKCLAALECGHTCSGTCGNCTGGRLHVSCNSPCKRILVCSHECSEPCTKNCPPCTKKCENRCVHSKCQHTCGKICVPCREKCTSGCEHSRCTNLCGEPCNNLICDRPCLKLLRKCGHRCIGLCGEDCPKLCRVCQRTKVTEIFFGTEDEPNARFIQLSDCYHIVEVSGMDQWMKQGLDTEDAENDSLNIQLKSCPKCKTPIRRSHRYAEVVKKTLLDIERVKEKVLNEEKKMEVTKERLKRKAMDMVKEDKVSSKTQQVRIILQKLCRRLSGEELNTIENQLKFLPKVFELKIEIRKSLKPTILSSSELRRMMQESYDDIKLELKSFESVLMCFCLSAQQLEQISTDFHRITVLVNARKTQCDIVKLKKENSDELNSIVHSLRRKGSHSTEEIDKFSVRLKRIRRGFQLGKLSDKERVMIISAMQLSKGHWYKCPNGHVYCIADCGGANQVGTCPECKASIGGTAHRLLPGNEVATEFSGARHAAWSEQANMANYDPQEIGRIF